MRHLPSLPLPRRASGTRSLVGLVALVALSVGCASGGGGGAAIPAGPSDEELVNMLITDSIASLKNKDIDALSSTWADDFMSNQGTDKAQTIAFLQGVNEQGFLDGMEIDSSALAVAVDGDTAEVSGVTLEGAFGVLDLSWKLEKRDGKWWVTYQAQE